MLPYGRKNPLPFPFSKRSPVSGLRQTRKGKGVIHKRVETVGVYPLVRPRGVSARSRAPQSALPAEVQRKTLRPLGTNPPAAVRVLRSAGAEKDCRPERANPPAAVRAPRWVGAEKEPPRQDEHAYAVRMPRSPGAEKPCRRFVHRHIKAKPRFPSVFFFICGGANRSCDRLRGAHRPDGFRCPT